MDALMVEPRIDRYELKRSCFTQISLPNASALGAFILSLGTNGALLLALAFTTENQSVSKQHFPPVLLKAVLVTPTTAPQKTEIDSETVNEKGSDLEHSAAIENTKKGEQVSSASKVVGKPKEPQKLLVKEPSPQFKARTEETKVKIRDATQDYINRLNAQRLHDIANQSPSNKTHSNVKRNPKLSNSFNTENEDFLKSIEIVVDCSSIKGKLFSALSKNKGVTIEDRDFPPSPGSTTVQGTVKCRDNSRFNDYINRRLNNE
ncbi:hypothetical protein [Alteromonas macleodii]|uniref:Uncharacterized protein n=1 Tax=Alteromonas macleodii TaxID=28108 RepID=A0A6T9XX82_ALTMA|nr:hypothetical protein [Alteromonas macleodii]CAB9492480.1 conserved protein of unknown function [Alteromonas macleodii]